jgi:hypothetical protein
VGARVDFPHQSGVIAGRRPLTLDSPTGRGHHPRTMSDEKPKPVDDLKQGLNLLFRAAKGAVEKLPTDKIEGAVKDGAKEVGKAFESVANELDKAFTHVAHRAGGTQPEPPPQPDPGSNPHPPEPTTAEGVKQAKQQHDAEGEKKNEHYDDAYAPEPRDPGRGPRIG